MTRTRTAPSSRAHRSQASKSTKRAEPVGELGRAISARIDELAGVSADANRLTRIYLTPAHRAAADLVMGWMRDAGMSARIDAVGNVVGRYEGASPGAPALLIGSHIDTVRNAGKFDGNLGVLTAIAVVGRLHAARTRLPFAIEVIAFGDEEGVRFTSTLGGSRALAGVFDPKILDERDSDGITRRDALIAFGVDPGKIAAEARDPGKTIGYVEVHIEQGPVLEAEKQPLAVVTAINGASRGSVKIIGRSGHAGTVPMTMRQDALLATAEMALAAEARARQDADLVATVGRVEIANAATNTVPGQVQFTLDVRSPSDAKRKAALADIKAKIEVIAAQRQVKAHIAITYDAPAATCDAVLSDALAGAIAAEGLTPRRMPSGAGHDAMAFRRRIPFTMLFVRCKGGISHHPDEFASADDIDKAARVLERFIRTFQPRH